MVVCDGEGWRGGGGEGGGYVMLGGDVVRGRMDCFWVRCRCGLWRGAAV